MRVIVTDFFEAYGKNLVRFSTPIGDAVAHWIGDKLPVIGKIYNVEVDFDMALDRNENVADSSTFRFLISEKDGYVRLNGCVDSVDEDGLVYFRLGNDCLIMIEASLGDFSQGEWLELNCLAENLHLTKFGS